MKTGFYHGGEIAESNVETYFEKSKEYANKKYRENESLIHSGKVNYMFLEIDKKTRAQVQPIGK